MCIECQNSAGSTTQHDNWSVQQIMNCAIALDGALVSSAHPDQIVEYKYQNMVSTEVASSNAVFFTNPYVAQCGPITSCKLYNSGCSTAYNGMDLYIDEITGKITAYDGIQNGWTEKVCVKCENYGKSSITQDEWTVHQKADCTVALTGEKVTPSYPDASNYFDGTTALLEVASSSAVFFTNTHLDDCGVINKCSLLKQGCITGAYTDGNIVIDATSGKISAKQNINAGHTQTVCIECENTAGSKVTHDDWTVRQYPFCETLTSNTIAPLEYAFDLTKLNIEAVKVGTAFTNSKPVACPITECELFQSDCVTAVSTLMSTYVSAATTSPWTITVDQDKSLGYPDTEFCY